MNNSSTVTSFGKRISQLSRDLLVFSSLAFILFHFLETLRYPVVSIVFNYRQLPWVVGISAALMLLVSDLVWFNFLRKRIPFLVRTVCAFFIFGILFYILPTLDWRVKLAFSLPVTVFVYILLLKVNYEA